MTTSVGKGSIVLHWVIVEEFLRVLCKMGKSGLLEKREMVMRIHLFTHLSTHSSMKH